ncbi:p6 [Cucurbit yellow stunting disorder virus]|uniref:p6 n=1 Tax=Cucurbit yellow stunting disorder virus TaxID=51330 RepID=Q808I6_9CLOS|nr:p6 [Cucurbit yellow stunting disorder virus]AAP33612.1 p6 [Cucurbit yellow stunting disorder virus]ACL13301.1 p6 [Cucurbit yellow stunting disorder virus]QTH19335.1 p6 protein [Cucurbit yellow stunting disorder virus]QTH19343.1 p6 protein [Cucurbit yellow stunting disorder virus]UOF93112.1 6 kDa protein [Cucurbit yellow stunting disorder virus]
MSLIIVIYSFCDGINIYYCSDRRDFEGDHQVRQLDNLQDLCEILLTHPFYKTSW